MIQEAICFIKFLSTQARKIVGPDLKFKPSASLELESDFVSGFILSYWNRKVKKRF